MTVSEEIAKAVEELTQDQRVDLLQMLVNGDLNDVPIEERAQWVKDHFSS